MRKFLDTSGILVLLVLCAKMFSEFQQKKFFENTSLRILLGSLTSWHEAAFVNLFFDLFYQKSLFSATSSSKVSQLGWNPCQFFHESFGLISAVLFRLRARSFLSFLYLCITQKALQLPSSLFPSRRYFGTETQKSFF